MVLKDIIEVKGDKHLYRKYNNIYNNLLKTLKGKGSIYEEYDVITSYARKTHVGKIKNGINISELELSMLCDGGFYHYGGKSTINEDGTFEVIIYTD